MKKEFYREAIKQHVAQQSMSGDGDWESRIPHPGHNKIKDIQHMIVDKIYRKYRHKWQMEEEIKDMDRQIWEVINNHKGDGLADAVLAKLREFYAQLAGLNDEPRSVD